MLALPFIKSCIPRAASHGRLILTGQNRLKVMQCLDCKVYRGRSKLQPEQENQESRWPAEQCCSYGSREENKQKKSMPIVLQRVSRRFYVFYKTTAVNNLVFGRLWLKSSTSESICTYQQWNIKGANFTALSIREWERSKSLQLRFFSSAWTGQKSINSPNKPICSELNHSFEASIAFSFSVIFIQIEMTLSLGKAQFVRSHRRIGSRCTKIRI